MFEIGNSLREARFRQHLELTEVELATKIRARYLRALEEETFDSLPAQTYVKGFLRTYADYLGLDGQLYVDEFNSRYGGESEELREPVVARRSSQVRRQQHRRVENRWVLFALAGIGAVTVFTIAAWKYGGSSNEPIPNLGAKEPVRQTKVAPPVRKRAAPKPVTFRIYMHAVHGNCWVDVRNWSSSGRSRLTGTIELGQAQRFVARRLWITFGAPGNLAIALNGRRIAIARGGSYVFTPRGFSRAA